MQSGHTESEVQEKFVLNKEELTLTFVLNITGTMTGNSSTGIHRTGDPTK
jgi:hypothetical protein